MLVRIGKVVRAVGLGGHVGIGGSEGALGRLQEVTLRREGELPVRWRVLEARPQAGLWAVRLDGVADRSGAEKLVGCEVLVAREDLGEAGEGQHYWADLEGAAVVTEAGEPVGKVTGVMKTGAVDVLVVNGDRGEVLVPLAPYVKVDRATGRVVVDPPEGLLDLVTAKREDKGGGPDEAADVAKLEVEILTLFPRMCSAYLAESILGKATENGLLDIAVTDIREYATGKHRVTDDAPYGGGAGMVMKPEPVTEAIEAARGRLAGAKVILTSPRGAVLDQQLARRIAAEGRAVIVCGRYEGVDERVRAVVDMEVSLGDFVLTGGELAALAIVDAAARFIPGVLGNESSAGAESFSGADGLLEHPHYTRPPVYRGMQVPEALLSGDHRRIERWRRRESLRATRERRPALFARLALTDQDLRLIDAGDDEL